MGDHVKSDDWARRALAIDPEETSILYNVACVYALLGRSEDALSCLGKVMEHGTFYKNWAAKDSDLDSLRSDPRFLALISWRPQTILPSGSRELHLFEQVGGFPTQALAD